MQLLYAEKQAKLASTEAKNARKEEMTTKTITAQAKDLAGSLKESNRRMAALYFEQAQADFAKAQNGAGLVRLAACWRASVIADDPGWKHTAWGAISAWARYTPSPALGLRPYKNRHGGGFQPGWTHRVDRRRGIARLWDVVTGQPRGPMMKFDGKVKAVGLRPDAQEFGHRQ